MYSGLVVSGLILTIFGIFLVFLDLYVPLGVSLFGFPLAIVGSLMMCVGYFRAEPEPISADAGKKFCWYCMKQIPKDAMECPNCSLPQHETSN